MKKYSGYILFLLIWSCAKDNAPDCLQLSGEIITRDYSLNGFERILVNENIELTLKMGSEYHLKIEAGEHLIHDVEYNVSDGLLTLSDNNQCNWIRRYAPTKIIVTTPSLTEIRSNTQHTISSDGVLTFPSLNLISENFNQDDLSSGNFNLHIQNESIKVISNNLSQFFISCQTDALFVGFYAGTTAFFGADLKANHITVYHRSSHDMVVNPQESLSGELRSTGHLISTRTPATVDVQAFYTGTVIFLID